MESWTFDGVKPPTLDSVANSIQACSGHGAFEPLTARDLVG